jgi:hypothetical protein
MLARGALASGSAGREVPAQCLPHGACRAVPAAHIPSRGRRMMTG